MPGSCLARFAYLLADLYRFELNSEHQTGGPSVSDGRDLRVVQAPLLRRMALLVRRHPTHPLQPGKPRVLGWASPVSICYHAYRLDHIHATFH